jgi:integrase
LDKRICIRLLSAQQLGWRRGPQRCGQSRDSEVERLIRVAKGNRYGQRDATMIQIGFRHGLRVSELCDLQWSSIEFETATMHVRRAKGGQEATHPLLGDELRALLFFTPNDDQPPKTSRGSKSISISFH